MIIIKVIIIKGTPILFFSSFRVRDLVDGAVFDFLRAGDFEDRVRDELGLVGGDDDGDDGNDGDDVVVEEEAGAG